MPNIHILLTKSTTFVSQMIAMSTNAAFTHASICLDGTLHDFYSFARRLPYFPLPAGLVCEGLGDGYWGMHPEIPCLLLTLPVSDRALLRMRRQIDMMMESPEAYRYDLLGLLLCAADIAHRRKGHYFCSQFVGELLSLSAAAELPCDPSLLHPDDFLSLPDIEICYRGSLGELAAYIAPVCSVCSPLFGRGEVRS